MSKVQGRRKSPRSYSQGLNFTKFLIIVLFIASLIGIGFLSIMMNDPASFGWGVLIGFTLIVVFYILWKYAHPYYLKRG